MGKSAEQTKLAELIVSAGERGTAVLTGAGISTPSGIPDFRSPTGLWAKVDPMKVAHIDVWCRDPQRFWEFYRHRLDVPDLYEPNPAHRALVELERAGFVNGIATQNIDGLHQKAGSKSVVELHGSVRKLVCLGCGVEVRRKQGLELITDDGVPYCPQCSDPLKPNVVLFGEMLPEGAMSQALQWVYEARLLICIGTSLVVHPVAELPDYAIYHSPPRQLAIVTASRTPYDSRASVKLSGDVATELSAVAEAVKEISETKEDD